LHAGLHWQKSGDFFIDGGNDAEEALENLTSPSASDAASLSNETGRHGGFDVMP